MKRITDELTDTIKKLDIEDPEGRAEKMLAYLDAILKANEEVNLTAISDRDEAVRKHLIDSLSCAGLGEFREAVDGEAAIDGGPSAAKTIVDVGTGGGFPGVPLAIAFPKIRFTLIDSLEKRLRIVADICEKLDIRNVEVVHGRAEDLAREEDHRDYYDLCISRAVANMQTLCELCLPFVRRGGSFIAYKGPECVNEVRSAAKAMELLEGQLVSISPQPAFSGMDGHSLVLIKKTGVTDPRYPRRAGIPSKKPL